LKEAALHLVYLDESGNTGTNLNDKEQPAFLLAALIVPETVWQPLERDLEQAINRLIPTIEEGQEIHATDLRSGQVTRDVSVLDPTCGSGAFLFAALGILQPLYEACLDRMRAFVEDMERSGERQSAKKFEDFRVVLADIERHLNRDYFVLKSIVVNNLYGVDIMEEAVEICELRLFLKLVAQVENAAQLEPLADIDFNIRPGNTLVGFATLDDVKRSLEKRHSATETIKAMPGFDESDQVKRIVEEAECVDRASRKFHEMQTQHGMNGREFATAKHELRQQLGSLAIQLDRYAELQKQLSTRGLWFLSFDDRPSRLFDGLEHIRLTIHILERETNNVGTFRRATTSGMLWKGPCSSSN
jgi:Protein of unknown function (DUF3800)